MLEVVTVGSGVLGGGWDGLREVVSGFGLGRGVSLDGVR